MDARTPSDEAVVAALCEALAPFSWRRFTPELMAQFALAARDRRELEALLSALPGASVGGWERLEPTSRADPRVARAAGFLADVRWTGTSLVATCGTVSGVVGAAA